MDEINKKPTCTQSFFPASGNFSGAMGARNKLCAITPHFFCCAHPKKGRAKKCWTKMGTRGPNSNFGTEPPWRSFPEDARDPQATPGEHKGPMQGTPWTRHWIRMSTHGAANKSKNCPWRAVLAYGSNSIKRLQEENKNTWTLQKDNTNDQDDVPEYLHNKYSQVGCTIARWQITEARKKRKR